MFDSLFNRALKAGVEKGVFAQPKGMRLTPAFLCMHSNAMTGASGGTKLAKKEPKPAVAKAPKTEKKAPVKPIAAKKAAAPKKPAAAKKAAAPKKTAAKPKTAPKAKAAAKPKKVAAPKAVSHLYSEP